MINKKYNPDQPSYARGRVARVCRKAAEKKMRANVIRFAFSAFSLSAVAFPAPGYALTTFTIDSSPSCCSVPAGEIKVSDAVADQLSFTVTLNSLLNDHFANTGIPATFAFNLPKFNSITFTSVPAGWTPISGSIQANGNTSMPGAGDFDYVLSWIGNGKQGGSNPGPSTLSFIISAGGLEESSLAKNAANYYFAIDILQACTPYLAGKPPTEKCKPTKTGVVGVKGDGVTSQTPVNPVPLPPALLLFGTALVGLTTLGRRRRCG